MPNHYEALKPKDLKVEWRRICQATGALHAHKMSKELSHLVTAVTEHESVLALSEGRESNKKCLLAVTTERLLILHRKFLTGISEKELTLGNIDGVDVKRGIIFATISVKSRIGIIEIKDVPKKAAQSVTASIREAKIQATQPSNRYDEINERPAPISNNDATRSVSDVEQKIESKRSWKGSLVTLTSVFVLAWAGLAWISDEDNAESKRPGATVSLKSKGADQAPDSNKGITVSDRKTPNSKSEKSGTQFYVNTSSLNKRDTPNGKVLAKLAGGQSVRVLGSRDGWARIIDGENREGWVALQYLSRQKPASVPVSAPKNKPAQNPISVSFKPYTKDGKSGANLYVDNSAKNSFSKCSIGLKDKTGQDRWYLPRPTVLDAAGRRSYPTFLFRDRKGQTPPTPNTVGAVLINCKDPSLAVTVQLTKNTRRSSSANSSNVAGLFPTLENRFKTTKDTKKFAWMDKGMDLIKLKLRDGKSAQFRNVYFHKGAENVPVTCGEVNAKNGFGAHNGYVKFVSAGRSEFTFLEHDVSDFSKLWARLCTG